MQQQITQGLEVLVGNGPASWAFSLDGEELQDVIEVAIFGTLDSPTEVHLLRIDLDAYRATRGSYWASFPVMEKEFHYQESYAGQIRVTTHKAGKP